MATKQTQKEHQYDGHFHDGSFLDSLSFGPCFDLKLLPLRSSADHPETKEVLFNSKVLSKVHSTISAIKGYVTIIRQHISFTRPQ